MSMGRVRRTSLSNESEDQFLWGIRKRLNRRTKKNDN
jgi:hypothetical protein